MSNTWLISDTHFNHAGILTFKDYDGNPVRPFDTVEQMNDCMMDNWNDVVAPNDTIIHCGDVMFGIDKVEWLEANFAKLPGKKKLILGNHDNVKYLLPFFKDIQLWYNYPSIVLTHMPLHSQTLSETMRWDGISPLNIHGHIHTNPSPDGPYKCVCVEQTDYKPVNLDEFLVK